MQVCKQPLHALWVAAGFVACWTSHLTRESALLETLIAYSLEALAACLSSSLQVLFRQSSWQPAAGAVHARLNRGLQQLKAPIVLDVLKACLMAIRESAPGSFIEC